MENQTNPIESLIERLEEYIKTTFELYKLKSVESIANIISSLVSRLIVILIFSLFVLVFNIGISLWLGEILGRAYYGFFVIALFYLLVGILIHLFRNSWIKKPLNDKIIKQALK